MNLKQLATDWRVTDIALMDETGIAKIYRGEHIGKAVALKIYHKDNMGNEAAGAALLHDWAGHGAATIYRHNRNAILLEWLDGASLGDLTRAGQDGTATQLLGAIAKQLHSAPVSKLALPKLEEWLSALFDVTFLPDCDAQFRRNMMASQDLARHLLATSPEARPLHGDLHHDNVKQGCDGWRAFDAKGVLADPAYELANAFRNPKGVPDVIRDLAKIKIRAEVWSSALSAPKTRLLQWAAVKCALSIAWRSKGALTQDPEQDLLELLLSQTHS